MVGHELKHYDTAGKVAAELVQRFMTQKNSHPWLLNVNVPDVPYEQLQGMEVTRLGKRHKAEPVIKSSNPHGQPVYWVGAAGKAQDAGEGTDFFATAQRRVSITPLQIDLTQYSQLDAVRSWLRRCRMNLASHRHRHDIGAYARPLDRTAARRGHQGRNRAGGDERSAASYFHRRSTGNARLRRCVACPSGIGQTISQPYIVARMTEVLRNGKQLNRVLEIGTGCGYQAAVLAKVAKEVYSVERISPCMSAPGKRCAN